MTKKELLAVLRDVPDDALITVCDKENSNILSLFQRIVYCHRISSGPGGLVTFVPLRHDFYPEKDPGPKWTVLYDDFTPMPNPIPIPEDPYEYDDELRLPTLTE